MELCSWLITNSLLITRFFHCIHHFLLSPFRLRLVYFLSLSFVGLLLLIALPMRHSSIPRPSHLDLFFMSVSASTVSSMDTVEMESFSNSQLLVLTLLMLLGGEVFTSMLDLLFLNLINYRQQEQSNSNNNIINNDEQELLELGMASIPAEPNEIIVPEMLKPSLESLTPTRVLVRYRSSVKYLWYFVLGYLVLVHTFGCAMILVYFSLVPGARDVVAQKGIRLDIFALFTTVSSFANCGFLPNNENMGLFRTNPGILVMVSALVLLGNTMYPIVLRAAVWGLTRMTSKKELEVILSEDHEPFLMSGFESVMLGATVGGLILVQVVLFCCLEWGSAGLNGMSSYQKVVGSLFMSINTRHAGESIVDLSALSPAVLVLYTVMMYLPAYSTFIPVEKIGKGKKEAEEENKKEKSIIEKLNFSQLSYLSIFTIIICITERRQISQDPLNFNVFTIVFEVISAYGNVGFSTGYSCKRRLKPEEDQKLCGESMVGFSGKWSRKGKLALIAVMIFGRLKKFNLNGGKAWMIR